jgi:hypothetical protein
VCVSYMLPFCHLRAIKLRTMVMSTHSWLNDLSLEFCELSFLVKKMTLIHFRLESATEGSPELSIFFIYSVQHKHQVVKRLSFPGAPSTFVSNEHFTVMVCASVFSLLYSMLNLWGSLQQIHQFYTFFLRQRFRPCMRYHLTLLNYLSLKFHLYHTRLPMLIQVLQVHQFRYTAPPPRIWIHQIAPVPQFPYLRSHIAFLLTPPRLRLQSRLLLKNL